MTPDELKKNVDTIIILMMENRSFDSVLGYLPASGNRPDVRGISNLNDDNLININSAGIGIRPFWRADAPFASDLPHGADAVHQQLAFSPLAVMCTRIAGSTRFFMPRIIREAKELGLGAGDLDF